MNNLCLQFETATLLIDREKTRQRHVQVGDIILFKIFSNLRQRDVCLAWVSGVVHNGPWNCNTELTVLQDSVQRPFLNDESPALPPYMLTPDDSFIWNITSREYGSHWAIYRHANPAPAIAAVPVPVPVPVPAPVHVAIPLGALRHHPIDVDDEPTCAICQEGAYDTSEQQEWCRTNCTHGHHQFHRQCLQRWWNRNVQRGAVCRCPICRDPLNANIFA